MPGDIGQTNRQEDPAIHCCPPPPRWAMRFDVEPSAVPDAAPTDSGLRAVVGKLRNGCTTGATGMKAEHIKEWLGDMRREEAEDGVEGIWDRWRLFVALL
jgi:hypothetical protein